ncbi:guanine deaminase [Craterilacuibacter sp. RT1T]|uniref:guanine deaminase n=1 Tax=Craterilacuibacter sp. RT1T TaxID=2942211 RepID=UPI0020BD6350|nr:guanine deaminase [Craterilacuibacter sp. RT1T]MCL6262472.1 guanine deaminase [Craterilacuibacter sp. RT1T]
MNKSGISVLLWASLALLMSLLLITAVQAAPAEASPMSARLAAQSPAIKVLRGPMLHFLADPSQTPRLEDAVQYFEDGMLIVRNGVVEKFGPASTLKASVPAGVAIEKVAKDQLLLPGFVDTHIHYPQTEMIGAYGEQLLDWLKKYTFPTEGQFKDRTHARKIAGIFLKELLKNGTTTALVFGTVHKESVDVLFEKASDLDMRLIAGKVMMDRNAPDYLLDTPTSSYEDSKALIKKWHHRGRLLYAITPRFAPTSSPGQLEMAQKLKQEFPDVYVHTHLSENLGEVEWVKSLFPERSGYLDVYDHYQLTGRRAVFAHGVHLTDAEFSTLAKTDSAIAFCPTSNLFLGSGLFKFDKAKSSGVKVGLGTDVGAGTSFSHFETMGEAYKIMQLQGRKLSAYESFYLATLGGAKSLDLQDKIGNLQSGKEADFVILNLAASDLGRLRLSTSKTLEEKLFVLMTIGDDRNVASTYVAGRKVYGP